MKFKISYFAKQSASGAMPALLAEPIGDFNSVGDAIRAAIADADKIGAADSITIDPIGEPLVTRALLVRTESGWEHRRFRSGSRSITEAKEVLDNTTFKRMIIY